MIPQVVVDAEAFVDFLNEKFGGTYTFTFTVGAKYIRIVQSHTNGQGSVHAFLDEDGLVYKPASWSRPAKGARYQSVYDAMDHTDPYGSYLYRGRT